MSDGVEVGIVAAMPLEIAPLVENWSREIVAGEDRRKHAFYVSGNAVAVCSGPTKRSAAAATKVLVEHYAPRLLLSTGFAGALVSSMRVPEIVIPAQVVDEETGKTYSAVAGRTTLVTSNGVAGRGEKATLATRWHAVAVDMEASAVAEIASEVGVQFAAVKAISDDAAAEMDFVGRFVTPEGFRTAAFLGYVALRPSLWPSVRHLRINSARASSKLCSALKNILNCEEGIVGGLAESSREYAATTI